jgi:DNA-binding CsgD family transcriptional regulator
MGRLEPVLAFLDELGSPEPGIIPCLPDAIEALVSLRRLEEAEALLERLERQGRALDRPWAIATALRADPDPAGEGEVERRAKQKRAARLTLEQALGLFQTLGAPLWAQRARDDLARVGGATPPPSELTPTEQRIAELEGKKNREVAEALFISVKTVEANLSRIFHKLGVRARTELTRRIATTHSRQPTSTSAGS